MRTVSNLVQHLQRLQVLGKISTRVPQVKGGSALARLKLISSTRVPQVKGGSAVARLKLISERWISVGKIEAD